MAPFNSNPENQPRTLEQIVEDVLSSSRMLNVPITEEQVADRYTLVGPADFAGRETVKLRCKVLTNPTEPFVIDPLADAVPEYIGTQLFGINVVEDRKTHTLFAAWDKVGNPDGSIDLGILSAFTYKIRIHVFEGRKPVELPQKGDTIDVIFELAPEDAVDELGYRFVDVVSFKPLAAVRGRSIRRRSVHVAGDGVPRQPEVVAGQTQLARPAPVAATNGTE